MARLEKERDKALDAARKAGNVLSAARKKCAKALEKRIQSELAQLDMPKVRFQVQFQPKAGAYGMDETGMDEVQFLMSANVGEDLKPIQKIASGGELARIMLALKNVLAENDQVGTMVFDEVDTGVSGRAAQNVAEKLAEDQIAAAAAMGADDMMTSFIPGSVCYAAHWGWNGAYTNAAVLDWMYDQVNDEPYVLSE